MRVPVPETSEGIALVLRVQTFRLKDVCYKAWITQCYLPLFGKSQVLKYRSNCNIYILLPLKLLGEIGWFV